jgi:hypothetical protein
MKHIARTLQLLKFRRYAYTLLIWHNYMLDQQTVLPHTQQFPFRSSVEVPLSSCLLDRYENVVYILPDFYNVCYIYL